MPSYFSLFKSKRIHNVEIFVLFKFIYFSTNKCREDGGNNVSHKALNGIKCRTNKETSQLDHSATILVTMITTIYISINTSEITEREDFHRVDPHVLNKKSQFE